jgi:hypothetical protein
MVVVCNYYIMCLTTLIFDNPFWMTKRLTSRHLIIYADTISGTTSIKQPAECMPTTV